MYSDAVSKRFWAKVDIRTPNECWLWIASQRRGYGTFNATGKHGYAHRISWELTNGPIPKGMCVLHRCDNPLCINPSHLWIGSKQDNTRDMYRKQRHPRRGFGNRYTADTVALVRNYYAVTGDSLKKISDLFAIPKMTVRGWIHGTYQD